MSDGNKATRVGFEVVDAEGLTDFAVEMDRKKGEVVFSDFHNEVRMELWRLPWLAAAVETLMDNVDDADLTPPGEPEAE